jgi:hypothetical protein
MVASRFETACGAVPLWELARRDHARIALAWEYADPWGEGCKPLQVWERSRGTAISLSTYSALSFLTQPARRA